MDDERPEEVKDFWRAAPILAGLYLIITSNDTRMLVLGAVLTITGALAKPTQ